jgi:hypothetical protein
LTHAHAAGESLFAHFGGLESTRSGQTRTTSTEIAESRRSHG